MAAQGIGLASSIVSTLLAQHTLRLHDAANENAALDALIPAFDADLEQIVQAYNSGTSADECIQALIAVDTNAYNYLRAQVGKPGTSWSGPSSAQLGQGINPSYSAPCNKGCTAGCCVYLNNLRPAIFGSAGYLHGLIEIIQNGGGKVVVPKIYPPSNTAYGNYERDAYTLTLVKPSNSGVAAAILQASGSGASFSIEAQPSIVAGPENLVSALTNSNAVTILAVVGGLILIITALFGQNALRVK
jgi:hypothetical protein